MTASLVHIFNSTFTLSSIQYAWLPRCFHCIQVVTLVVTLLTWTLLTNIQPLLFVHVSCWRFIFSVLQSQQSDLALAYSTMELLLWMRLLTPLCCNLSRSADHFFLITNGSNHISLADFKLLFLIVSNWVPKGVPHRSTLGPPLFMFLHYFPG